MVRNFQQQTFDYPWVEHNHYTSWIYQEVWKFPDVGNWVVYRCDDHVNKFVALIHKVGEVVGYNERKLGRRIAVRKSGDTIVTWGQWHREIQDWRVKLATEWGSVSIFEVYDTEGEALAHL